MSAGSKKVSRYCLFCFAQEIRARMTIIGNSRRIADLLPIAIHAISNDPNLCASSQREIALKASQFYTFIASQGIESVDQIDRRVAEAFINMPTTSGSRLKSPEASTRRNRRSAVRSAFRALRSIGIDVGDPTIDAEAKLGREILTPICTDAHIAAMRGHLPIGVSGSTLGSVLALAEAGATNSEISLIRAGDIDTGKGVVRLPGNQRVHGRVNQLTEWGLCAINQRMMDLVDDGQYLVARPNAKSLTNGEVSLQLRRILEFSRTSKTGITVNSIRAWRARQIFETSRSIEEAARFLGAKSLDAAASLIRHDWRTE
jgi:integrase/recombinase XerC